MALRGFGTGAGRHLRWLLAVAPQDVYDDAIAAVAPLRDGGSFRQLMPSLADFGDAEVAQAEAAIEGFPSAAGPDAVPPVEAVAVPPVEAPDIKVPEITADTEQAERP